MTTSDARARAALSTAASELRQATELVQIVKTGWQAENLRAEKLQQQVDLMKPVVAAAQELVRSRNERHGNASNPEWWQGGNDWPLVHAVEDYEWKLKQLPREA